MIIYEAKLNDELLEKLIAMSADWEAKNSTYGYRKNDRSDIEGNRIFLAEQAASCGDIVLLVNPYCAGSEETDAAAGGVAYFKNGSIAVDMPSGNSGAIIVEI